MEEYPITLSYIRWIAVTFSYQLSWYHARADYTVLNLYIQLELIRVPQSIDPNPVTYIEQTPFYVQLVKRDPAHELCQTRRVMVVDDSSERSLEVKGLPVYKAE